VETGNEGDDEDYDRRRTHGHPPNSNSNSNSTGLQHRSTHIAIDASHHPDLTMQRERTVRAASQAQTIISPDPRSPNSRINGNTSAGAGSSTSRRTTIRGFGQQPVIETSTSPAPSDVASNRSTGTNQSSGAFFRTYQEAAPSSRSNGALTPDLNFAEIGHGRGANNATGQNMNPVAQGHGRRGLDSTPQINAIAGLSSHSLLQATHPSGSQVDIRRSLGHDRSQALADSSNSYRRSSDGLVAWPHVQGEMVSPSPPSSPTTRELHESVQSALGISSQDGREGRGRRVKRSLRNTISAAENYATSFLFGRGHSGVSEGNVGSSNTGTDNGSLER
jgi:F-box and leucine-rich repeat protein GRR1